MVGQVAAVAASAATGFVGVGISVAVHSWHARRFNAKAATDLLDDWRRQLELLDPAQRRRAELAPPANVVAAMATLPVPGLAGLRGDWNVSPVESFDRH